MEFIFLTGCPHSKPPWLLCSVGAYSALDAKQKYMNARKQKNKLSNKKE